MALLSDVLQNLFTQPRQNIHCSNRSIGKAIKRNSRKDCPSSSRYRFETISGSKIMEVLNFN